VTLRQAVDFSITTPILSWRLQLPRLPKGNFKRWS